VPHVLQELQIGGTSCEGRVMTLATALTPEQARTRRLRRERRHRIVRHAILLTWTAFIVFPIFWMVATSFKDSGEWVAWPPHWLPHAPTLHNYAQIFAFSSIDPSLSRQAAEQAFSIWKGLGDAVVVCTTAALLALFLGTFLAYAISRFGVGGKYFRHTILTIRMIPPIVVAISILIYYAIIIPYVTTMLFGTRVSLFDTYIGLILIYTVTTLPFVIWMMLTFIDEVPYTLEHAARLMGAGRITVIRRVVLPLVASGMVVTFLFVFILNWAEFLLALTLTHPQVTTLTVLLNKFQSASEGRLYGPQAAIGTMITIPVVILGIMIQKHLVKGFSFGTIRR
jgi:multiple sugar transport system permease protein